MTLSEDELRKRLERDMMFYESADAQLKTLKPEKHSTAFYTLGRNAQAVAVDYLLLDDVESATAWFQKTSCAYSMSVVKAREFFDVLPAKTSIKESEPGRCEQALNTAVLSGDDDTLSKAISVTLGLGNNYPKEVKPPIPNYYYAMSLAFFLTCEPDRAFGYAQSIKRGDRPYEPYFEGINASLSGLIKSDRVMMLDGLRTLLLSHSRIFGRDLDSEGLVCFPASSLVKLARKRGMNIGPEDFEEKYRKYIPWSLFDYA